MKKIALGAAAVLCLALTSAPAMSYAGPGHRAANHHRHKVCHMRHHRRVCTWR
jgi:hypothetical protein